jgi:type VI secretion system protein ImpH
MSTPQRRQPLAVIERLFEQPHRFQFFQAVQVLEQWFAHEEGLNRAAVLSLKLQFRNSLSLAFPASEIAEFDTVPAERPHVDLELPTEAAQQAATATSAGPRTRDIAQVRITPAFMGLLGAGGALPNFYTELFAQREVLHRDRAARAFLDIFQHRALVLFYEAWRKHRLAVQYQADRHNRFTPLVLSLAGLGQRSLRQRLAADGGVQDESLAFFAGTLQRRPVSPVQLQRMVVEYFRVPVRVEQFVGRWFDLPAEGASLLGQQNGVLGQSAVMGERIWQRDLRLRLSIGPLKRADYERFLPGGRAARALSQLLQLVSGTTLEYEVRLVLRAADVLGVSLDGGAALGLNSFLHSGASNDDRNDASYEVLAAA